MDRFEREIRPILNEFNEAMEDMNEHGDEMQQEYAREFCLIGSRTLLIFGPPSLAHCAYTAYIIAALATYDDIMVAAFASVRVLLALPKPWLWYHMRAVFKTTLAQPTGRMAGVYYLRATQRSIHFIIERKLSWALLAWQILIVFWALYDSFFHESDESSSKYVVCAQQHDHTAFKQCGNVATSCYIGTHTCCYIIYTPRRII